MNFFIELVWLSSELFPWKENEEEKKERKAKRAEVCEDRVSDGVGAKGSGDTFGWCGGNSWVGQKGEGCAKGFERGRGTREGGH